MKKFNQNDIVDTEVTYDYKGPLSKITLPNGVALLPDVTYSITVDYDYECYDCEEKEIKEKIQSGEITALVVSVDARYSDLRGWDTLGGCLTDKPVTHEQLISVWIKPHDMVENAVQKLREKILRLYSEFKGK